MVNPLIGIHAGLGELAAIGFLWVLIELISPTVSRVKRAKKVALIAVILLFISWVSGGYYYVNIYGADVKPIIKEGPQPWAHLVFMETKEHVFLFLPFLGLLTYFILSKYEDQIVKNKDVRIAVKSLALVISLLAFGMAFLGYQISSGARAALESLI